MEEGDLGPLPTLRPELEHFLEMPTTSSGTHSRQGYLPELSIKNYELWLEWQVHQLDTPHWWEELTALPEAGDIKKLPQKICTSFDVPAVQCEALRNQDYTAALAPKYLKRDMFMSDGPSYQDVWLKPQWITLAYVQVFQYWAEEANLLAPCEPHPLAMSVRELT